jgi:probable HAF family extracellular repeat protein
MQKLIAAVGAAFLFALLPWKADAATYSIVDLGSLGETSSYAEDINASGQVAGFRLSSGLDQSFLYTGPGGMQILTPPGGTASEAYGINDSGQVTGYYYIVGGHEHAYIWTKATGFQDLGMLPGGIQSYGYDISNAGAVCGYADTSAGFRAFLYTSAAGMQSLGTLAGGSMSKAYGMNNTGEVVGYATAADGQPHAFLYTNGTMSDLTTFGGLSSKAYDVNDSGQVVGNWVNAEGQQQAFLWNPNGAMTNLGGVNANAENINDLGAVVGESTVGASLHAFLWQNNIMTDLNTLIDPASGWTLNLALHINDSGQIVGVGTFDGETDRAFLLNPTPEPVSIIFFGTGLVAVGGFVAQRKMRKAA